MERSEAIEIVREYYPSSGKDLNEALEALIPELKENEDERIRKELIEHVKDQQSSFISAPDCRDRYEEEENDKYNSWIAWLEKQGSQNLANSAKTCKVEQNPAWSEEDEKMIDFWNLYYEHKVGDMPNKDVVENLEKFRDWLKSLKDRVKSQQKSDWNNNDEINFNRLMAICADERVRKSSAFSEKEIKDLMAWFESIKKRVQPQWKPSDEQINALARFTTIPALESLYNDLKKLTEKRYAL